MLRMIVCDWNGTLFREPLDKTFFLGLCRRAFWRALRRGKLRKTLRLMGLGARCLGLYLAAKGHPDRATRHVGRIVDLLNPDVFRGLARDDLDAYTRRYARRIGPALDRRLLEPLLRVARETGIPVGVVSSACRGAIEAALSEADCAFDFVLANEFRMDGGVTASFDFVIADNKLDVLTDLLAERNVAAADVMYIGDSPQDEPCLHHVGTPVVSFWATAAHKERFSRTCGALAPADGAAFEQCLRAAAGG